MNLDSPTRDRVARLCVQHNVERLELFGSAARGDENPRDLDFIVVFQPVAHASYFDAYFDLKDGLEELFGLPVDLVELEPIRNPYFLQAIEADRTLVYAA